MPLAIVRGRAERADLSRVIRELFDRVYSSHVLPPRSDRGLNVVFYTGKCSPEELELEAGIQVPGSFCSAGDLIRSQTPAGTVATSVYWGAYEGMKSAHDAIQQWCREHECEPAGPSWEIYGHWSDDPATLRTDVYYLLH